MVLMFIYVIRGTMKIIYIWEKLLWSQEFVHSAVNKRSYSGTKQISLIIFWCKKEKRKKEAYTH